MFQVQDFIDKNGLCQTDMNIILDQMKNPGFRNPLYVVTMQQAQILQQMHN